MNKKGTHEGENLKRILLERFDDLQSAATALDYNYSYLSTLQNTPKLPPKVRKKIAKLLGIHPSVIEGSEQDAAVIQVSEPETPYFANKEAEAAYWQKEVEKWRERAYAAMERLNKMLEEENRKLKSGNGG